MNTPPGNIKITFYLKKFTNYADFEWWLKKKFTKISRWCPKINRAVNSVIQIEFSQFPICCYPTTTTTKNDQHLYEIWFKCTHLPSHLEWARWVRFFELVNGRRWLSCSAWCPISPSSESESVNELAPRLPPLPTDAGPVGGHCCWTDVGWPEEEWWTKPLKPVKLLRLFNAGTDAIANEMGILSGIVNEGIRNDADDDVEDGPPPVLLLEPLRLPETGKTTPVGPRWMAWSNWSSFFILSFTDTDWIERNWTGIKSMMTNSKSTNCFFSSRFNQLCLWCNPGFSTFHLRLIVIYVFRLNCYLLQNGITIHGKFGARNLK